MKQNDGAPRRCAACSSYLPQHETGVRVPLILQQVLFPAERRLVSDTCIITNRETHANRTCRLWSGGGAG